MTEKEKMLAGELYYASDEELTKEHNIAQRILWKFDNSQTAIKSIDAPPATILNTVYHKIKAMS